MHHTEWQSSPTWNLLQAGCRTILSALQRAVSDVREPSRTGSTSGIQHCSGAEALCASCGESVIVPVTAEEQWLPLLSALPTFEPGRKRMVVISPHPDDETLSVGGLIASQSERGVDVLVIAVTDGENSYADVAELGALRTREQEGAVETLSKGKAKMVRLGIRDSGVADEMQKLVASFRQHVDADTHVIAPWCGDFHPDHEASGRAALEVARSVGAQISWYFFWTWHRGTPQTIEGLLLQSFPLTDAQREVKVAALRCHQSQLEHVSGEPILPENLLGPAGRSFEVFASA